MFCPRAYHTSGSRGVLLGALLCWLCIVLWFFCCLPCVSLSVVGCPLLARPPEGACCQVTTKGCVVCASPHFQYVTVAGGLFRTVSHSRLCSSYSAQWLTPTAIQVSHHKWLGALLYPRSRVLCQQSAIPYVAVVVFSCLRFA